MQSMKNKYVGQCILLNASCMYNGRTPRDEGNMLFQYSIIGINEDLKTSSIDFDENAL